ncbi:MAG: hypothetical protein ACTSWA_04100 [Candidatus Thorarchaeota archaeon]
MTESKETTHSGMTQRIAQYYAKKEKQQKKKTGKEKELEMDMKRNREQSGGSLKGWMNKFTGGLDLPFKSISLFAGSWMLLEIGWHLIIIFGVATAGSVWSISTTVPCLFIAVYVNIMISGMNMIRSIITQLGNRRDNLVKALFRGYFWSLLSIGLILIVHEYFHTTMPNLFILPILYFIPIQVFGNTIPFPLFLGLSGWYMDISVTIVVYVIGITGSAIGGIEILRNLLDNSSQRGTYGAIFGVLLLAVFPVMNVYFSLVFLTTTMDLFGRCVSFGA